MKKIIFIISLFFLTGCAEDMMYYNLNEYKKIAPNISLGDDQDKVLGLLLPIQEDLPQSWKRPPEQFMIKNDAYYIHFHRTGWVSDDRLTDDESTPYVFKNKKLVEAPVSPNKQVLKVVALKSNSISKSPVSDTVGIV